MGDDTPARRSDRYHDRDGTDPYRSRFRQDRDRILYSAGFRRLGGVTQISAAGEFNLLHNRLTHSLKVGQVGRTLAEQLLEDYRDQFSDRDDLDPDVVEAAGLAHDIGHPPFGHAGEVVLATQMEELAAGGFEGNAQTFRYLAKTALRRQETKPGSGALDLTRATLNAVIKYPWSYNASGGVSTPREDPWWDRNEVSSKKYNAYSVDDEIFTWARIGFSPGERSLEAALMDWADDISYAVHDFEDYVKARLIPIHALESTAEAFRGFAWSILCKRYGDRQFSETAFDRAIEEVLGYTWQDPFDGSRDAESRLGQWVSRRITEAQKATKLKDPGLWGFAGRPELSVDEKTSYRIEVLKLVPFFFVVSTPGFDLAQRGQQNLLKRVFLSLLEVAQARPTSTPAAFDFQFDLLHRLQHETSIDYYLYVTFTTPTTQGLESNMRRFVDRLQGISEFLPLRTVPLRILEWGPVRQRMDEQRRRSLELQVDVVNAWQEELDHRFSGRVPSRITEVPR